VLVIKVLVCPLSWNKSVNAGILVLNQTENVLKISLVLNSKQIYIDLINS